MPRWKLSAVPVVAALLIVAGCNKPEDDFREFGAADDVTNTTPEPEHPAHGPHDGHLIELGAEEYHGEVVMDAATRKITVYLLGPDAATAALIGEPSVTLNLKVGDAPTPLTLAAAPQEGEAEGNSSRFEIAGESVPEAIKDEEDLHGDLVVTIEGKQYRGEISHDHEGHDHGEHGHAGETHP
jgi:hypothetical protein